MTDSPMLLDTPEKRTAVRLAIERTCAFKQWPLLALNVRTNHVHVVLESSDPIEAVLAGLKGKGHAGVARTAPREGQPEGLGSPRKYSIPRI
jgi:REP element-mobilizing transposase RayT